MGMIFTLLTKYNRLGTHADSLFRSIQRKCEFFRRYETSRKCYGYSTFPDVHEIFEKRRDRLEHGDTQKVNNNYASQEF